MLRTATRLLLAAGCAAIGAAGAIAWRADLMVGYGVGKAFEAQRAGSSLGTAMVASRRDGAEVGDEGYWLTRSDGDMEAPFDKSLVVGDRISITGRGGRLRTLEVVDLKVIGAPGLHKAAAGASPLRLVRVTARVVAAGSGDREELVHFFVEAGDKLDPLPPGSQRQVGRT